MNLSTDTFLYFFFLTGSFQMEHVLYLFVIIYILF